MSALLTFSAVPKYFSFLLPFGIAQLLFLLFNFEHNFFPIIAGFIYIYPRAA